MDLDPQAAEIAVVNLMMRAMEGQSRADKRLPLLLNQNIKVGNVLVGLPPKADYAVQNVSASELRDVIRLRHELLTVGHGERHDALLRELPAATRALAERLDVAIQPHFTDLDRVRPFHWGVEFPEAFFDAEGAPLANPGFAVIIGNPPWEILKPDLREFYAQFDEKIESRYSRDDAEKRIAELDAEAPVRRPAFEASSQSATQTAAYARASGLYKRQGRGDPATHKLFIERMYSLLRDGGRLGYVVPSGIYTDLGTKDLREMLLNEGNIQYIYSFSNERFFFPGVHHAFKFAMIGVQRGPQSDGFWSVFRFNPRVAIKPDDLHDLLTKRDNLIYMHRDMLKKFSPDSLSVMEFQSKQDYEIVEKIYGKWPLLGEQIEGSWSIKLNREFDMTNDRHLFTTMRTEFPLYEGKMIHHFDAFFGTPQYWLDPLVARKRLIGTAKDIGQSLDYQQYRLGIRAVAASTNERTLISTIIPKNSFAGNSVLVDIEDGPITDKLFASSVLNSFCIDYILKSKVASNVNMYILYQLPVPRLTAGDPTFDAIIPLAARLVCTRSEFADLWQSVMNEVWDESKAATDPAERTRLRDRIDALVARLYGLTRAEFDHILGTFPLVFPDTDAGRARRAALLTAYDAAPAYAPPV